MTSTKANRPAAGSATLGLLLGVLLCLPVTGQSASSPVRLNELQADNVSTLQVSGAFPDWIELHNPTDSAVSLGLMSLSDKTNSPGKFLFSASALIGPRGYVIVYCDGTTNTTPPFHAPFKLGKSGKTVYLYDAPVNGTTQLDFISYGLQLTDLTIGRVPDGTGPWQLCKPTPALANMLQPMGSQLTLKYNEWLATNSAGPTNDWIELYNPDPLPVALGGLYFVGKAPPGNSDTPMQALSFIDGAGFFKFTCDNNVSLGVDHLQFKLSSTSGESNVNIYAANKLTLIEHIDFLGGQLRDTSEGRLPDGSPNIVRFLTGKSTPGASNFLPLTNVVINEVLTHTDPPLEDAIELHNPTAAPVDISYWWLSNSPDDARKFQIPAGTILAAGGYKVFYELACPEISRPCPRELPVAHGFNTTGTGTAPDFTLNSAHGDQIFLATGDAAGNLTGFRRSITVESSENGVSFGRYITSEGKTDIVPMSQRTFGMDNPITLAQFRSGAGLSNAYPKVGPVVINEIMYHPPDVGTNDNSIDEYIELFNLTAATVSLYDPLANTNTWKVTGAVDYVFPRFISLSAAGYLLLVNFDPITNLTQLASFRAKYAVSPVVPIFGPYAGKLKNSGDTIQLYKPDPPQVPPHPDAGFVPYILVDKVRYDDKAPWPLEPDGFGKALQRITPELYGNDPINWTAAAPTPGRQLIAISNVQRAGTTVTVEFNGVINTGYTLLYKTSLSAATWQKAANVAPQSNSGLRMVSDSTTNGPARFYRIVTPAVP